LNPLPANGLSRFRLIYSYFKTQPLLSFGPLPLDKGEIEGDLTSIFAFDKISLMRLTKKQREKISRIFEDLGKLVFISHVLGLLISPETSDIPKIILGFLTSLLLFILALIIDKEA